MKARIDHHIMFAEWCEYLRARGWRWPIVWYCCRLMGICWADRPMPAPGNENTQVAA